MEDKDNNQLNNTAEPQKEQNTDSAEVKNMSRRSALKYLGIGAVGVVAVYCGVRYTPLGEMLGANENIANSPVVGVIKKKDKVSNAEISILGFGCMRFPLTNPDDRGSIDEEQAMKMIDYAYKNGVNYFDTAWFYHDGKSEPFVGKALKQYPRESFYLATKMPTPAILGKDATGLVKSIEPLDRIKEIFDWQLERCQTDYIDFFFLHSLRSLDQYKEVYIDTKGFEYLLSEKEKGRVKRLGFSFHGPKEELPLIADQYKWDFCMIQNNYFDWEIDGKYLYDSLEQRGIQSIFMEPVRGGMLATLSPAALNVYKEADASRSAASWAIRWCASMDNCLTVLSGMSNMEQVEDNVKTLSTFKKLDDNENKIIQTALTVFKTISPIPCTLCDYCVSPPCPAGIDISKVFAVYNECVAEDNIPNMALTRVSDRTKAHPDLERQKRVFLGKMNKIAKKQQAVRCTNCGECLPKCPQNIEIAVKMQNISDLIKQVEKS